MTEARGTAEGCGVSIRGFRPQDLSEVIRVESESFDPADRYASADFEERLSLDPVFLVAAYCGTLVGYSLAVVEGPSCYIDSLAVGPGFRRRGIGTLLLLETLKECGSRGAVRAWLEVSARNAPAISLYRKAGFVVVGRARDAREGDVYVMVKEPI